MAGEQVQLRPLGSGCTAATVVPLMVSSNVSCPLHEVASQVNETPVTSTASPQISTVPLIVSPIGLVTITVAVRFEPLPVTESMLTCGLHASPTASPLLS